MNKQTIKYILLVVFVALLVVGGTFAFWSWNSNTSKNLVFNTVDDISKYVVYDEGEARFTGDLGLDRNIHSTIAINKTTNNINLTATINMKIIEIGTEMASSSALKWKVTSGGVTQSNGLDVPTGSLIASGNFSGKTANSIITLAPNLIVTTTSTQYTIGIWLDSTENPSSGLTGESLSTSIWTEINQTN